MTQKFTFIFQAFLLCCSLAATAQNQNRTITNNDTTGKPAILGGLGIGIDYGGIGVRAEYQPLSHLGIQGGLGYNLNGFGYNFGASFYPFPDWKVQPYITGLYGYNAVIVVSGRPEYNKTYYGFSAGLGFALKTSDKGNKLVFELFKPFRHQAFTNRYDELKNSSSIDMGQVYIFTFSIGYNWRL
ncbi:MAG TPA: hypothetical protein VFL76_08330 [Edaphocola sp.]|nr:hypothetical protein [Edaphocola sp.]